MITIEISDAMCVCVFGAVALWVLAKYIAPLFMKDDE